MADVVKAPVLVVEIVAVRVRIPVAPETKNGHWEAPCTEGSSNDPTGHEWKTSKMTADPRLYKKKK